MNYRVASPDDAEAIAKLHAQSWVDTYRGMMSDDYLDNEVWTERKSSWAERFTSPAPNQYVAVATEVDNSGAEDIAGFICAFGNHHDRWGTFVDNLHVADDHQSRGIGKAFMLMAAQWSMQTYPDNGMYLEVLEENHGARRFYKRLGATHQETNLWQPPGDGGKVKDMLFVWEKVEDFIAICNL